MYQNVLFITKKLLFFFFTRDRVKCRNKWKTQIQMQKLFKKKMYYSSYETTMKTKVNRE